MNKEQKRILFRKILPKILLVFIIFSIVITFIVLRYKGNKADVEVKEFMQSGGGLAATMKIGMYDSLIIDNLIIKYPSEYKITSKFGQDIGGYNLKSLYSDNELTIEYLPKANIEPKLNSIDEAIESLAKEIANVISKQNDIEPSLSETMVEKKGQYSVHIKRIEYGGNSLLIYGIESNNKYIMFRSYLNLLLNGIIENISET